VNWKIPTEKAVWVFLKAQLDGAWLGSFYVITDVFDKESYSNAPCILPGGACDWASEARWIAAEAVFSRSSKGLGAGSCCGYTGLAVYATSQPQENNTTPYSTSRAEPTRARPLVRHLSSCAASCSQIVFSVPICWPSTWRHVTRRAARRLVPALRSSSTVFLELYRAQWSFESLQTLRGTQTNW
jgi:hypothetical protein